MQLTRMPLTGFLTGLLLTAGLTHAANYSAWTGNRSIVLNTSATGANVANNVVKVPVLIRLTSTEASIMTAAKAGGADIRFSKSDGSTPLPYEIESWEPNGAAIWVLVDTVKGNNSTQSIKMYWGNPAAVSESNGSAVYDTANGYVGAWHFGNGSGDVRPGAVAGSPAAFVNNGAGQTSVKGLIGRADTLRHFPDIGAESTDPLAGSWIDLTHNNNGTPLAAAYPGYSDFSGGISFSLWTRPEGATPYWRMLVMAPDDAVNAADRILFMASAANDTAVAVRWTSGCGYVAGDNPCNIQNGIKLNEWNHVFVTKAPGNGPVQFYINGTLRGSSSNVNDASNALRNIAWIGRAGDNNPYFSGLIDNATLAKSGRSADFIKLSYENQKATNTLVDIGLGGPVTTTPYGSWSNHRTITLNTSATGAKVSGTVTNFPLLVRLTSAEASILSAAKAGGADIRFSKIDDATALPYHIESWDANGAAIWVKVDTVKGNNATQAIRMHWSNAAATSQSNSSAVFDTANGYRAVFHMSDAAGDITDGTVNAVVGTNVGTTPIKGVIGSSRNFAGTNAANTSDTVGRQYINLNNPAALNFAGRITMSAWVRWVNLVGTENVTYYRTFINRDGTSPSAETFLRIGQNAGNAEHAQYTAGKYTGSADIMAQSPQFAHEYLDSALWTHLVGVYDSAGPTTRVWRLYRNGVEIATSTDDAGAALTGASTLWRLGRGPGTQNARWFSGDMDEVRISSVTRDSNWVKLSYESQRKVQAFTNIGVTAPSVPGAPTNAVAVASGTSGSGQVTVTWKAPADNGGANITAYTVTGVPGGTCPTTGALTCNITGLTLGTSYTFTVKATNSAGQGAASVATAPVLIPVSLIGGNYLVHADGFTHSYTFRLPEGAENMADKLTMTITDAFGRTVWQSTVNPSVTKSRELSWNGKTQKGKSVSAGMYIVRIKVQGQGTSQEITRKNVTTQPGR